MATDTCPTHPEEKVIATCSCCGKGLCRQCRDAFGYFCSEECKGQAKAAPTPQTEAGPAPDLAALGAQANRIIKLIKWRILPAVIAIIVLVIIWKATSKAGEPAWTFMSPNDEDLSTLTIVSDTAVVASEEGKAYGIDTDSGEKRWEVKTGLEDVPAAPPLLFKPATCVMWDSKFIAGIDAAKGKAKWKVEPGGWFQEFVTHDKKRIYYIVHPRAAQEGETTPQPKEGKQKQDGKEVAKPADAPTLHAVSVKDGKTAWKKALAKQSMVQSFAVRGENAYIVEYTYEENASKSTLTARSAKDGKGLWQASLSGGEVASIHPTEKAVVLASDENIYAISPKGKKLWKVKQSGSMFWPPVVKGHSVIYQEKETVLACLDLKGGKVRWRAAIAHPGGSPYVSGRLVYVPAFTKSNTSDSPDVSVQIKPKTPILEDDDIRTPQDLVKAIDVQRMPTERLVPTLLALDLESGKTRWEQKGVGGDLVLSRSVLFAVEAKSYTSLLSQKMGSENRIVAMDPDDGDILWRHSHKKSVGHYAPTEDVFIFTSYDGSTSFSSIMSVARQSTRDHGVHALSIGR